MRTVMANTDVIKAVDLLREHCKPVDGTPLFKYDEDWDDNKIAEKISSEGRVFKGSTHISSLRTQILGGLFQGSPSKVVTYRDPRVTLLVERFNELVDLLSPGPEHLRITADDLKDTSNG